MLLIIFFFFNDTATTEIYTLSLHDALPILLRIVVEFCARHADLRLRSWGDRLSSRTIARAPRTYGLVRDRKSTRLNSSHSQISYAVFCLKKKKTLVHSPPAPEDSQRVDAQS